MMKLDTHDDHHNKHQALTSFGRFSLSRFLVLNFLTKHNFSTIFNSLFKMQLVFLTSEEEMTTHES